MKSRWHCALAPGFFREPDAKAFRLIRQPNFGRVLSKSDTTNRASRSMAIKTRFDRSRLARRRLPITKLIEEDAYSPTSMTKNGFDRKT
jgi:hypothetical protein